MDPGPPRPDTDKKVFVTKVRIVSAFGQSGVDGAMTDKDS
jgi:hypothetical protein